MKANMAFQNINKFVFFSFKGFPAVYINVNDINVLSKEFCYFVITTNAADLSIIH